MGTTCRPVVVAATLSTGLGWSGKLMSTELSQEQHSQSTTSWQVKLADASFVDRRCHRQRRAFETFARAVCSALRACGVLFCSFLQLFAAFPFAGLIFHGSCIASARKHSRV